MKRKEKIQELRNNSSEELLVKEKSLKEELFKLNAQRYTGRVDKPHRFSSIKRDIARIHTILSSGRNTKTAINKNKISASGGENKTE